MARSSTYGNILSQMPNWVFGGEFGDISNLLNSRDMGYEKLQAQELANDENQLDLENKQRRAALQQELRNRDIFNSDQESPLTLRDMYGRVRDASKELGSVEDYIQMQEKIDAIDRQQRLDKQQSDYKDALIAAAGRRGTGKSPSGSKRLFQLENPETGEKGVFLADEANKKLEEGWDFYQKEDPILEGVKKRKTESASTPKPPSDFDQFVAGMTGRNPKPGEQETKRQQELTASLKENAPGAKGSNKPTRDEILAELERRKRDQ